MILNSPYISGSLVVTGNEVVTGSLTVLGGITGAITGSATSASYAANTSLLNNKDSGEFVLTGSFNSYTSSNDATVTSVAAAAVSAVAGVNALAARTGSYTTTSSFNSYTASNNTTMSCVSSTATSAIAGVGALAAQTGSYATTGSNTFVGGQYLSSSFNPTGFSTTASLYTDGGLRVTRDAYISGTLYLNNVTVFGTQSVAYITSSQLNISTNLISVNTDTPSVRFGGLSVYDSGSTGLTGSILWDSENNRWVYSNPSGSSYDGGMFISGPRNSSGLGNEVGTTACMLLAGQGGDHLTSSMIYHSSTATCFYGGTSFISSNGDVCFNNLGYVGNSLGVGIAPKPGDGKLQLALGTALTFGNSTSVGADYSWISDGSYNFSGGNAFVMATEKARPIVLATSGSARMCVASTGVTTFTCQTCAPAFYASTTSGRAFGNDNYATNFGWIAMYGTTQGIQLGFEGSTGGQLITGAGANYGILVGKAGLAISANNGGTNHLNINSTGAATFSSTVSTAGVSITSSNNSQLTITSTLAATATSISEMRTYNLIAIPALRSGVTNGLYLSNVSGNVPGIQAADTSNNPISLILNPYGGNVGIGCTTPSYLLDVNGQGRFNNTLIAYSSGQGLVLKSQNNCGSYIEYAYNSGGSYGYIGSAYHLLVSPNNITTNLAIRAEGDLILTSGGYTPRLSIFSTGIACFSCQICVKERVWVSGTFPGVMLDRSSTTAQSDIQWKDSGTSVWSIGTAVAAVGSNLDFYSYGLGNVLKLAPTGEACFRYVVCAQSGIIPGVGGNLLSTYNESISFTPCLYFQGAVTGLSYATRSGYYSRIGNMVIAQMYIQWCKASSATDNLGVYLPVYTANNTTPPIGNFYSGNQPSETRAMSVYGSPNSNLAILLTQGGGGNLANCFANSTLHYWSITMAYLA